MYKRILFIALCVASTMATRAQVTMALQVPPTGVMQKTQLWNMALVYTGNTSVSVYISLTLLNAQDNTPVMTATSRPIILTRGTRQINGTDVAPVQYTYLSSIFNVDRDPNGFLPVGNFKACYIAYINGDSRTELAEECVPVEVQPLSPPQLNLPADTAVLDIAYPQFNWLPPSPLNLFSNLSYDMLVVEVSPGQSPYEAIQQNMPVYNISNYTSLVDIYPASNKALDTARVYAWRVIAKNEGQFVAQSEVWTFKIATPQKLIIHSPVSEAFIKLKRGNEAGFAISKGAVRFIYANDANDSLVNYIITDLQDSKQGMISQGSVKVKFGENFITLPLSKGAGFMSNQTYLLKVINSRKEEWSVKFLYKEPDAGE